MSPGPMAANGATVHSAEKLRDEGNAAFKSGDMAKAAERYTAGLAAASDDAQLKATLHRNRAMVRLRLSDAVGSEADCTAALEFDRADPKALYRRALAREELGNVGEAFSDAKLALRFEPKDKNITQLLQRLAKANIAKQEQAHSTDNRVREMDKLAFAEGDPEQRARAINNLLVLARESQSGAQRVWADGAVVPKLLGIIRNDSSQENVIAAVRALDELAKDSGATAACVAVSKTESKNSRELLARCLFAFSTKPENRGRVIKEGGAKLALELCKTAAPEGQIKAGHALARLGSNADPAIAFPGQRAYEVVKPLVDLLHPDIDGMPNYDALLTLTNLASMSDSVRKRILKGNAISKIEEYWFMTEHAELRDAAAELLLNLLYCEDFLKMTVEPGTDRLKLWVLYAGEPDERLALASSAGFVILTEDNAAASTRILDEISTWPELFKELCMAEHPEVQRRCLMAIANMVESDEKVAARIMQTEVFRVLIAITKLKHKAREGAQEQAQRALSAAEKHGLIAPTDREAYERKTTMSTIKED
uniref:Protein unc-45 homolog B n=1 Tax=Plectus sambesii TaxID=2011161 RepID=A0A914VHH0_9BILA